MSGSARYWDDLKTRTLTGVILAAVGAGAVWAGGAWFLALMTVAVSAMFWELSRIVKADDGPLPILFGLAAGVAMVVIGLYSNLNISWAMLLLIGTFGWSSRQMKYRGVTYAGAIILTGLILFNLRQGLGVSWVMWLVLVVIASDIAGYLAGRAFGGPKFWPAISPKKTWSGTVAGWFGAAGVGACMIPLLAAGYWLIPASVFLAFCGQLGDIAQSALKRQAGIKDASNLLPGHGGVMDRLDALIGASVGFYIFALFAAMFMAPLIAQL